MIVSGTSEPHLKAIANEIHKRLKDEHGLNARKVDGFPMSQWIVMDFNSVVVHIFHTTKRAFYALEDLWSDAPRLPLDLAEPRP